MKRLSATIRAALFLDRDGVIIRDAGYLGQPAGVALLPGARTALRRVQQTHRLFLLTNQSGIGRGYFAWRDAEAVHARMLELLQLPPPGIEQIAIAAESPGEIPVYRKPSPRFLLETLAWDGLDPAQCWMVGDRLDDVRAGIRAGIRAALIATAPITDKLARAYCRQHSVPIYASLQAFVAALPTLTDPARRAGLTPSTSKKGNRR
ncbi:MAG: HAD-IIIA family hydrolase [bacterium]